MKVGDLVKTKGCPLNTTGIVIELGNSYVLVHWFVALFKMLVIGLWRFSMKVGDLVRFKYTRPPNRWTNKAFLVSACTETRILLVGAHFWSPHGKSDKTQWHPREGWEVVSESR